MQNEGLWEKVMAEKCIAPRSMEKWIRREIWHLEGLQSSEKLC
jgi:hypothetical protein